MRALQSSSSQSHTQARSHDCLLQLSCQGHSVQRQNVSPMDLSSQLGSPGLLIWRRCGNEEATRESELLELGVALKPKLLRGDDVMWDDINTSGGMSAGLKRFVDRYDYARACNTRI